MSVCSCHESTGAPACITLLFYIDSISSTIFICDKLTIRHIWQSDGDINSVQGPGAFTTIVASTAGYGIFLDAYPWDFGVHGNGFSTDSSCIQVLRGLEARSELCNSPADWKFYRRWRSSEKGQDVGGEISSKAREDGFRSI